MKTLKLKISPESPEMDKIKQAAEYIKSGKLVAFPTETVYGLGANALDPYAVKKIYIAKGRPEDNPLIVHVSSLEMAQSLVVENIDAFEIAHRLWPGPVTLIFHKSSVVPSIVTAMMQTVGLRFPAHPIAIKLIESSGVPIAAPSANLSGKPSPTEEWHVVEDLDSRVECIIQGGKTLFGLESTIIDMTRKKPRLLRPGPVSPERLKELLPDLVVSEAARARAKYDGPALSPGMKYRHYSPDVELILVEGNPFDSFKKIKEIALQSNRKTAILCSKETEMLYGKGFEKIVLGSREDLYIVATNLFSTLRELPGKGFDLLISEAFPEKGIGLAIMNRLRKAAWKVINTD
ncbi:translation factor Sua5 [Kosmotoga arenicorallina S304]|uniref:Threonylcarbamoyl-AMP synthase n=1 Tax=Kosmotoga arenicorallina S304 TaxID=1453497 RepID=A0A176K062_9BACT|nr:L-threonylcarbamoyladenylate synthase [Kosmotoga arenicorallina]OAA29921.1 translation factor Sua5 [Kosmotoga arenicorallina S304]